ncbi:hypothetical protein J7I84_08865 [Arthrobacter sp. ISL-85]|uniref:hypothetical protein n=1 Tax=Arthrobacter sp. ISL-85 TaxID=2819115 RepID=UPI001BE8854C|nr:hypothetical protein [Arthrobacter sp. ISL-85]MBT2566603.1 hypothetical protein [Arthrobacter sp. ISL-85]
MPYPGGDVFPAGSPGPLATVEDLGNYMQQTIAADDPAATFLLLVASGMIRAYLGQTVSQVTDDVEYVDPVNGSFAALSQLPVTAVSLVEITNDDGTNWTAVPPTAYKVSRRRGTITTKWGYNVRWPTDEESWRVTYTHGFESVPAEIIGVCCGLAARYYSTPIAIELERVGQRQVKYAIESAGFTALESIALTALRPARLA